MKESNDSLNKWRNIPHTWIKRLKIAKMLIFAKLISRVNEIPIKILANYFVDIDKLMLKFTEKGKRPNIPNTILK